MKELYGNAWDYRSLDRPMYNLKNDIHDAVSSACQQATVYFKNEMFGVHPKYSKDLLWEFYTEEIRK